MAQKQIDHGAFIAALTERFPEVAAESDPDIEGARPRRSRAHGLLGGLMRQRMRPARGGCARCAGRRWCRPRQAAERVSVAAVAK